MKSYTVASVLAVAALADDCSYFYDLGCTSGDVTTNPSDWADRSFQTYLPGSKKFQD